MKEEQLNIPALIEFVRKHQDYKSTKIKDDVFAYKSISDWIDNEQIAKGAYPIKASLLHSTYIRWCESQNMDKKLIAKSKSFHATMKTMLNHRATKDNLIYYINKRITYEPQKKNDQAASNKKIQTEKN